jgi:hypothetical protein
MLRKVHRFLALPVRDQILLFRAFGLVVMIRIALRMLPFGWIQDSIVGKPRSRSYAADEPPRIIWAVTTSARYVKGARCLCKAFAAHWLMRSAGTPSEMKIGLARDEDGQIKGHAWLEADGATLFYEPGYVPIVLRRSRVRNVQNTG